MGDFKQRYLCWNADVGHKESVLHYLRQGATPNGEGNGKYAGRTPLGCAAGTTKKQGEDGKDPLGCLGALLDAGAEPDRPQSKDGMTPLCLVARDGHTDRVRLLLKRGATPGLANKKTGETPLSLAVAGGHQQVVEAFLKSDADLSAETQLPLGSYHLGDAAVEALLRQRLRAGCALVSLDLGANDLTRLPPEIGKLANLQTLKLRDNDLAELPPELTELRRLRDLDLGGNPRLRTVEAIARERGISGVFDYLRVAKSDADLSAETQLLLGSYRLGDAAVETLLRQRFREGCALVFLDLGANDLTRLPPEIGKLANLQTLKLRDNDLAELPPELTELRRLRDLDLGGNPRLRAVEAIARERGIPGVFDYLRDLHDDPQPNFKLKVLLAGPSMAGKSSVKNRLMDLPEADVLADADTERTIGLDIAQVVLPDPRGRAPRGIVLIVYDAGGHDEYQEMQQVFVTTDTLYILLWNVAKRPREGQDEQAFEREMVGQQVQWAQLIQSCAPGSTVRVCVFVLFCFVFVFVLFCFVLFFLHNCAQAACPSVGLIVHLFTLSLHYSSFVWRMPARSCIRLALYLSLSLSLPLASVLPCSVASTVVSSVLCCPFCLSVCVPACL
eukprot:COSAG02_NODE_7882_length_2804_cov_19.389279_1_plen_616_part_00